MKKATLYTTAPRRARENKLYPIKNREINYKAALGLGRPTFCSRSF
jgi:hypothetical protein